MDSSAGYVVRTHVSFHSLSHFRRIQRTINNMNMNESQTVTHTNDTILPPHVLSGRTAAAGSAASAQLAGVTNNPPRARGLVWTHGGWRVRCRFPAVNIPPRDLCTPLRRPDWYEPIRRPALDAPGGPRVPRQGPVGRIEGVWDIRETEREGGGDEGKVARRGFYRGGGGHT